MADTFKNKLVVVVRNDLKLTPGKMAVQVAHAAVTCSLKCKKDKPKWFREWYNEGQKKAVVKVSGIEELRDLMVKAESIGLPNCMVQDAGLTQIPPGTVTCLGVGPAPYPEVNKVTGDLKLL